MLRLLSEYQKKYSSARFKSYAQGVVKLLQDRTQRLQTSAPNFSSWSEAASEGDGEGSHVGKTEELLSAVLSAHLVLSRIGLLYGWRPLQFTGGIPPLLHRETTDLAGALVDAWEVLGVSGETRRQILQRLILEVGRQTLETRQQINKEHHAQLASAFGKAGQTRGSAALRETEGKESGPREDRLHPWILSGRFKPRLRSL